MNRKTFASQWRRPIQVKAFDSYEGVHRKYTQYNTISNQSHASGSRRLEKYNNDRRQF